MTNQTQNTDQLLDKVAELIQKPKDEVLKYVYLIPSDKGTKANLGYKAMAELAKRLPEPKQ